jgi:hypothetical protein
MRRGIGYWKEELEEWSKFLRECGDELSLDELSSVMKNIRKIQNIIDTYLPERIGAKW